jgi:hypothetical protein
MAVTAVYAEISRINIGGGQSQDYHVESNIGATTAAFLLQGGRYGIVAMGSTFGTLTLQVLAPDSTTWITAATAIAANGVALVDLPQGQYRWALA